MNELNSSQQIKYGAMLSYSGIVLYILIGLLYTPWMIRCIGQADYGLYTLAYSIISLFVFDFGISSSVQRFVAKYNAEGRPDKVNMCLSIVYKLYCILDIVLLTVLVTIYFFTPLIYREFSSEQISQFKIVYLIVSVFSVLSFPFIPLNGVLSAHEKFVQLKSCDLFSKITTVFVCVICLWYGYGLVSLVLTNSIIGLLFIGIKIIIVFTDTNVKIDIKNWDKPELKNILGFSMWTMAVALCQRSIFSLAPTILGMFDGALSIAILGVAISLEAYNYSFAYALNGLFLPRISRILNEKGDVLPLMIRVGRIQILTIGFVLIMFIIVGQSFIINWLGDNYGASYWCTLLFIVPAFLLLPADVADQTLIADGKVKYRGLGYLIMSCVNIPLSLFLTKYYGLYGLAVSIFCAYMIRNIALYIMYYQILHIDVGVFFKSTFIRMGPGLCTAAVVSSLLVHLFTFAGWLDVLVSALIVTIVYVVVMYLLALNASERNLMFSRLKLWKKH